MANPYDAPITKVLAHYFGWDPPDDNGNTWIKTLCPSHREDRPSASVSFEKGAVRCQACGFKGDVITIIMREEGITYREAIKRAEAILGQRYEPVSRKPQRKPGRRIFGQPGADGPERSAGRSTFQARSR